MVAVRDSIGGLNTRGLNWRKPSASTVLHPPESSDGLFASTAEAMPKRARELSAAEEVGHSGDYITSDSVKTFTRTLADDGGDVRITSSIIEEMQKLARYRKKLEILQGRKSRLEELSASREQILSHLEQASDELASADAPETDAVSAGGRALETARFSCDESAHQIDLVEKRIKVFELNIAFSRDNIEETLGQLLSGRGLFGTTVTNTESSQHSSIRSSKRPRVDSGSIDRLAESDSDEDKKRAALAKLHETEAQYREAQYRFGSRSELYRDALEQWQQQTTAGVGSMTRTDFDVEYCIRYGDLGLDLIEAEANRSKAALEVMELNARPITLSQTSKFADDPSDAEELRKEAEHAMSMLDVGKVEAWLQTVQEDEPTEQQTEVEADDWEAQSLQYGESCNGVAEPWTKLRLKRWNGAREARWVAMREELQGVAALPDREIALPSSSFVIEVDPTVSQVPALISEMQA